MEKTQTTKERLDLLLLEQGYFESREKAKAAIMAGLVLIGTERVDKAGTKVPRDAAITVKGSVHPYVSRGGLKLEKAIKHFGLDLRDAVMLDIGASTGGFTDCALQNGAALVYAVDVGYNQLDWSLRQDERVQVLERTNFRHMTADQLDGPQPGFASIDVSFISLKLILPVLAEILRKGGHTVALIKPQFEAGREHVGKSGVIRDPAVHAQVLRDVLAAAAELRFELQGLTYSPITGGEGNIEFLAYWLLGSASSEEKPSAPVATDRPLEELIAMTVEEANRTFRRTPS
ncbi:TlyA family rRNA (cytidine-2'-O)-methyltransferase [Cohnella sp. CIP 111063]|uniref:TlyA family RNA methyltransferase n=1 Tax=unclassified Cohnella TaxID=2636738 RepID=UPI000B8BE8F3|nr:MULTISPECIES: TlyA family RNA methyltransferase [unclassified Cohnella]OXS52408.1 TlyA family rRNA (cytidine-2'-O)-methyltransferase [Cohnella sp. CIP 111063]PRX58266.1 23S rRNA (cytidine1920-2'-O)/16S rRNA (cytidine1409-2'-O)-methyltransferase [Cohnella sp. SGD-V74]